MTTSRPRRRVTSIEVKSPLGELLREMRETRGMTQVELASSAGLRDSSTVSRLESGKIGAVSLDLLGRLVDVLGDDGRLWAAAGMLPVQAVQELAPLWRAHRPNVLREQTRPIVQRVHQGEHAEELLGDASVPIARRVDVQRLANSFNPPRVIRVAYELEASVSFTDGEIVVVLARKAEEGSMSTDRDGELAQARFLAAHAIAHIELGDAACHWPRMTRSEVPAVDMACRLLAPQGLLEDAVQAAVMADVSLADPWRADSGRIVVEVARRLGLPAWVALRRLGEDASYESYTEEDA